MKPLHLASHLASIALVALALSPCMGVHAQDPTGSATLKDTNGNTVTVVSRKPMPAQEDLQAEFDGFDTDRDGGISPREARIDKYLARSFRALDDDRNGRLQFDEAREWLDE